MRRVSGGVHERRDDRRRAVHLRDRHRRRGGLRPAGRVPLSGTRPTRSHATKAVTGPVVVRMMGFQAITRVEHVCATGRPAGAPPSPPPPSPPPPTSTRSRLPRRTTCSLAPRHVGARFARSSARFARAHARFARVVMLSARRPRTQVSRRPLPSRARARAHVPRASTFKRPTTSTTSTSTVASTTIATTPLGPRACGRRLRRAHTAGQVRVQRVPPTPAFLRLVVPPPLPWLPPATTSARFARRRPPTLARFARQPPHTHPTPSRFARRRFGALRAPTPTC